MKTIEDLIAEAERVIKENQLCIAQYREQLAAENQNQVNDNVRSESKEDRMSRDELLTMLQDQIQRLGELPPHVRNSFVTNLDLEPVLWMILAIFKAE